MKRLDPVFLFFFALYCLEAGVFFTLAPWNPGWERVIYELPIAPVRALLLAPLVRGLVSGFGLVHLVWSVHDFRLLAVRRRDAHRAGAGRVPVGAAADERP